MIAATAGYAAVVVLLAYVVRGLAGFGSGLIAVPLLSMVAPVATVVPAVTALDYLGSAGQSARAVGRIAWRDLLALIPFTLVGVSAGIVFLRHAPTALLGRALGAFVIGYAIYQLLPARRLTGGRAAAVVCGLCGGLVGTLFGTGGPFYAIYYSMRQLDKASFRASFATTFLIDGGVRLITYAFAGLLGVDTLLLILAGLPFMLVGLLGGSRLDVGLTQRHFVWLVSAVLLVSGTVLLLRH